MNLKSLELFGFKSFMRKLDIHFSDGITVIVGPNGCGKTNVTDALRWVLGEPNARNLRGKAMQDLIFNGTRDYKPLNVAEVSLTVDNSAGVLPIEYAEVTVTRRVFRDGESEFLINKVPGRLRDIHDLFMDTGLGSRAYSIIEREMVEMVLADQPEKRRELLEEAAGIMKYKTRERQARRKLEATDDDMKRIEDVLREVERQVRSLKRQVGAAQRFQEMRDRQRELEVALAMVDVERLRGEEADGRRRLEEQITERDGASGRVAGLEAETESRRLEMAQAESALAEIQRHVDEVSETAQTFERENAVRRERREALLEQARRLDAERQERTERVAAAERRREELSELRRAHEGELAAAEGRLRVARASLENVESDLEGRRRHLVEARAAAEEAAGTVSRVKEDLANLEAHGEHLADRLAVLGAEAQSIRESMDIRERETRDAGDRAGRIHEELSRLEQEIAGAEQGREELDRAREESREEESRLSIEMESHRSGLELLRGLRDSHEGLARGPQQLLSSGGRERRLEALAEALHVTRPDLIPALDAALESAIQFVVAPSRTDAVAAIRSLADSDGRATVVDSAAYRALPRPDFAAPDDAAVIGPARDFLDAPAEIAPVLDHLLCGVVLVETLDDAVRLAGESGSPFVRFVSRSREWAQFPGLVHGGGDSSGEDTLILGRSDRIAELEGRLGELEQRRSEVRARAEGLAAQREEVSGRLDALHSEREQARERLASEDKRRERANAEQAAANERHDTVARELASLEERTRQLDGNREARRRALGEAEATRERLDEERARRENELVGSTEDRDRARQQSHDAQLALERARAELEKLGMELSGLEESRRADLEGIERRTEELESTDRTVGELAREIDEGEERLGATSGELGERRKVRDEMAQNRAQVLEGLREVEVERGRWAKLRDEAGELVHEQEMRLTRLESARRELTGRLEREFSVNLSLPDASEAHGELLDADEETLLAARADLENLRKHVERMGAVNLVALEQYERESRRYEFLKTQKEDLDEAREKLRRTIRKINRRARTLFMDTLEEVRVHFQETFGTLFIGGQADIRLAGDEDPLHAPIEIFARPRGKRLASISLMSSGERSLTAVAFLFAIYLVKPSPFCILDEVDAPLDDANVGRFLDMLKRVAQKTQFVMITHNKKTMEVADFLYGVTMEEPGVSKLVSVNLGPGGALTTQDEEGRSRELHLEGELVMEESA